MSRALIPFAASHLQLAGRFSRHLATVSVVRRPGSVLTLAGVTYAQSPRWFSGRYSPAERSQDHHSWQHSRSAGKSGSAAVIAVTAAAFALVASSAILADASPTGDTVVDPATGASLPRVLSVPADSAGNAATSFKLVGYGARQVTFLSINVYSVGIYVPTAHFAKFASTCTSAADCNLETSLSQSTSPLAIYLVPARNSSAAHLRDGFVRTFMTAIAKAGPEADREKMLDDVNKFKAVFPTAAVEKGHKFVFVYLPGRGLRIMHQGVDQGVVESPWLGKALFEAYLRTDKPISPKLRANVIEHLVPAPTSAPVSE